MIIFDSASSRRLFLIGHDIVFMENADVRGSLEAGNIHVDLANFLPGTFVLTTHYLTATFALIWPLQTTEIEEIKNGSKRLPLPRNRSGRR